MNDTHAYGPHEWMVYFAVTISESLKVRDPSRKKILSGALRRFKASEACDREIRRELR